MLIDEQPSISFLKKNADLKAVPMNFEPEYYGIGIKKGNDELLKLINETL